MNKKIIIVSIVAIVIIFLMGITFDADKIPAGTTDVKKTNVVFHATLADPDLYIDGVLY